jgi:hypothetical protein
MTDQPKDQRTEQTPTGFTVPVPKRDEFFGNLKKAAEPEKADSASPAASEKRE